jgi:membrane associated rhomboid family serine protease
VLSGISIGGHIGGLIAGAAAGFVFLEADRRRIPQQLALAASVVLAVVVGVAAVTVAHPL